MADNKAVASSKFEKWIPGVRVARTYDRSWIRFDLTAGVVLAAILVPTGMAYAELAGLPAVTGLYTTIACLVGYAIFGPSRILVLGPDSSVSPLVFAAIVPLLAGGGPAEAIALAGMLAVLVGLIEIGLGIGKLGFVSDLLSSEVQIGYMNGLAITIIVGQLPKLFGFSTDASGFFAEIQAFAQSLSQTNRATLAVGLAVLAVLFVLPRFTKRVPAVLVGVVGATVASAALSLSELGVSTVGALPQGFPTPHVPWTSISHVGPLFIAAIGIVLVSLTDTIALSTSFASKLGDDVDPDQEMIGIGAANVAAGFLQGFAISASGSRTPVAEQSGAKSQVTGLVGAAVVGLMLLFFNSVLAQLPNSALAAVVIAAGVSLMNIPILVRLYRMRKSALVLSLVASLGVILLGVLQGIVVAIVLAVLMFFRRNWWPHAEVLGQVDGLPGWHSIEAHPDARQLEDIAVFRWEAPLFFANTGSFRREIRKLVRVGNPTWVVVQCEAITDIDVTAGAMLRELDNELNTMGVHMAFAEVRSRLQELMWLYGLDETLDRDHFYPTIETAIDAIRSETSAGVEAPERS